MSVVEEVFSLFEKRGSESYFGEPVSVTEHCLQAAYAAQTEGAPAALVEPAAVNQNRGGKRSWAIRNVKVQQYRFAPRTGIFDILLIGGEQSCCASNSKNEDASTHETRL